jgi:hypothetical protein
MRNFILLFVFCSFSMNAQKNIKEYKASNGVHYKIGDTITMGRGSGLQGSFVFYQMGGWGATMGDNSLPSVHGGTNVILKKIKVANLRGAEKVWFVVNGGNITNYNLFIEDAIATCEIKDCNSKDKVQPMDKYDQLKKIKELLDNGTLTQEEYEIEKKDILRD